MRFFQHIRIDRGKHARFLGPPQPAGIDGDQDIGRAEFAFGPDAFNQRVGIGPRSG